MYVCMFPRCRAGGSSVADRISVRMIRWTVGARIINRSITSASWLGL